MKALNLKNIKNLKGERKTMKNAKRMGVLLVVVAMVMSFFTVSASAYGYTSDYYGSQSYGSRYPYNVEQYVVSGMRNSFSSVTSKLPTGSYASRMEIIKHCYGLIKGSGYNFNQNGWNNTGIYGYSYLQSFADYNQLTYQYSAEELRILSDSMAIGLLRGIEENGVVYAAPEQNVTREQYAAFLNRTMQTTGISTFGNYQMFNFMDVPYDSWSYNDIQAVVAKGIMRGYDVYNFGPYGFVKGADALLTYYSLFVEQSGRYQPNNFAIVINNQGYYYLTVNTNTRGNYFSLDGLNSMNVGERYTLRVSTDIPNYNNYMATWSSSNESVVTVDEYGTVYARGYGKATIYANCQGLSDSTVVTVTNNGSSFDPFEPQDKFGVNQSFVSMQRGTTQNFSRYIENANGNVQITSADPAYVSVSGMQVTANQVTTRGDIPLTIYCNGETATIHVQVVDNNAAEQLNIRVNYSGYISQTGVVSVVVSGLPAGYSVKINDDDYMSNHVNNQDIGLSNTVKLQVTGLYPEGGRDALIVCVYNQSGVQVWEDPNGAYCPQTGSYLN